MSQSQVHFGVKALGLSLAFSRVLRLATTALLARMLAKEAFGALDLKVGEWPVEQMLQDPAHKRKPRHWSGLRSTPIIHGGTLSKLATAVDDKNRQLGRDYAPLSDADVIVCRAYTGPMYVKYNSVLRREGERHVK